METDTQLHNRIEGRKKKQLRPTEERGTNLALTRWKKHKERTRRYWDESLLAARINSGPPERNKSESHEHGRHGLGVGSLMGNKQARKTGKENKIESRRRLVRTEDR
jgi:hypothetical protein